VWVLHIYAANLLRILILFKYFKMSKHIIQFMFNENKCSVRSSYYYLEC